MLTISLVNCIRKMPFTYQDIISGGIMRTASITFKTSEEIKDLLEKLAKEQFRSLSQQCEMVIVQWLKSEGHLKED